MVKTVHIVDDDASFRSAVQRRLRLAGYDVATYSSAQELLEQRPDESGSACILLDARIPKLNGLELQRLLVDLGSKLPIVFLSAYVDTATAVQAIKAGAEDFLIKPVNSEQLLRAIDGAIANGEARRNQNSMLDTFRFRLASLTPRERQVFELVIRGKQNKEIAHAIGSTERTIKAHRHKVFEKMRVQSLAQLVSVAERLGVVTHDPEIKASSNAS